MAFERRFTSWSASRLDDYNACPNFAALKHLDKLCTLCFRGRLVGKFGEEQKCNKCGKPRKISDAMERGGVVGKTLEEYVNGKATKVHPEITHPNVLSKAKALRAAFKKGKVIIEKSLNFDHLMNLLPEGWSPEVWLIVKMDVWELLGRAAAHVLDWKTGGIDKRSGVIRANEKYDDQLFTYEVAGLCAYPGVDHVSSSLGFVDAAETVAGRPQDAFVQREPLARADLAKAVKKVQKLGLPIMADRIFKPVPSDRCRYCDYSQRKGGPCPN